MSRNEDKDFSELLEDYMTQNHIFHMEGEGGVRNLRVIAEAIGYRNGLEEMLADNPGMQNVMVEWLMQQDIPEWKDTLLEDMPKKDDVPDWPENETEQQFNKRVSGIDDDGIECDGDDD